MTRRLLPLIVITAMLAGVARTQAAEPLPSDARFKSGTFENGVRWIYRQHDNPPGKMALMFHVDSGSLNETDAQRGLAHFIEHMAFNGSENFPPGALIPYFESIGMEFGGDVNAFTSFDQTAYMLFLPDTKTESVDKALMALSDQAFRALFVDEEIEKERGVVLSEMRAGKGADERIRDELWPKIFEGSRFAERLPIGTEEVLSNAPREEFVDYYNTWYRPDRVTVFLVGDADPEPIIPLIKKWFGGEKPKMPTRDELGAQFKPFSKSRAFVGTDKELPRAEVSMMNIAAARPPTVTVEQLREELVENLATWMLSRRFQQKQQRGEASYINAGAYVMNFFNEATAAIGQATGDPDKWNNMLDELIIEVSRAKEHGFSQHELDLAKKEFISNAERAVKTDDTRNARSILFQINSSINAGEPLVSAQQRLDLTKRLLPGVSLDEVDEVFRKHFGPDTFAFEVDLPLKDGATIPSSEDVLAAAHAAMARKTEPLADDKSDLTLLEKAPTPGKIVESSTDDELNINHAWLSNGVRVHHRFMDYKKDQVSVSIALAGGSIQETAANAGVTNVAALAFGQKATSRLNSSQIDDLMTGKNIRVFGRPGDDALRITVSGSPEDLEAGLELAHALLTDGKIEESAFDQWKQRSHQFLERMKTSPEAQAMRAMMKDLSGDDPRITMMTEERLNGLSRSAGQEWLERMCKNAPIEVAVVGEIDKDKAMELVAKYIGSLPSRDRSADALNPLRKVNRKPGPWNERVTVDTVTPRGMVMFGFIGPNGRDSKEQRALNLAQQTISTRLIKTIREDLGLVYSIRARNQGDRAYPDMSGFMTGAPCDPSKVDEVMAEAEKIFTDFAENGPTDEELSNAKKQIANNIDTEQKEPGHWLGLLSVLDLHDIPIDDQKNLTELYNAYSADEIRETFAKYYKNDRKGHFIAVPVGAEAESTEPAGAAGAVGK